jgi:hypothetical protein
MPRRNLVCLWDLQGRSAPGQRSKNTTMFRQCEEVSREHLNHFAAPERNMNAA